jgi:hypothetical protein
MASLESLVQQLKNITSGETPVAAASPPPSAPATLPLPPAPSTAKFSSPRLKFIIVGFVVIGIAFLIYFMTRKSKKTVVGPAKLIADGAGHHAEPTQNTKRVRFADEQEEMSQESAGHFLHQDLPSGPISIEKS